MRRIAFIASAALASLACGLLPAGALAHGHHHRGHHARRARHHSHLLLIAPNANTGAPTGSTRTTGTTTSTATPGSGDTGGPTGMAGNAGSVVSFTEGVLTIKVGEGEKATTVSGKVTEETEIHCIPAAATTMAHASENGDPSDGESGDQSDDERGMGNEGDQGAGDDNSGERNLEGGGACHRCSPANLTPGAIVHSAELRLDASGAVFREIVLVV
jgi:hypothetical protein